MADGPLSARHGAQAYWTGREAVIVGGDAVLPPCPGECFWEPEILSDGAAYDPAQDIWRPIEPAPVPLWASSGIRLDGDLYVLAPDPRDPQAPGSFLRYRFEVDAWNELPPPEGGAGGLALMATNAAVLAYQRSQEAGSLAVQAYDVVTASWSSLPPDPLSPSYDRTLVWTGRDLVLIGIRLDPLRPGNRPPTYVAAVLDAAESWRLLPESEIVGWEPSWFWAGGRIVNPTIGEADGGQVNNWGRLHPFGGTLTPGDWTWGVLPNPPDGHGRYTPPLAAAGDDLVLGSSGWVMDIVRGQWAMLPSPPTDPTMGEALVWAGNRLIVWGGIRWGLAANPVAPPPGLLLDSGAIWTP